MALGQLWEINMAFPSYPTRTRTWSFSNTTISGEPNQYTHNRKLLLAFKNALQSLGWTAVNSSNGSIVLSGDTWGTIGDLNWYWEPYEHSWLQLYDGNYTYLVIDLVNSFDRTGQNGYYLSMYISPGEFTGGTLGHRPHNSTYEFTLLPIDGIWGGYGSLPPSGENLHVMVSDDRRTRVFMTVAGNVWQFYLFEWVSVTSNSYATIKRAYTTKTLDPTLENLSSLQNITCIYSISPLYTFPFALTTIGYGGSSGSTIERQLFTNFNPATVGSYAPIVDIWAYSQTTHGIAGKIEDLWFTGGAGMVSYATFDNHNFIVFGSLVVPWDGTPKAILLEGFHIPDNLYWSQYGEGAYWYHQRCKDNGPGGGFLYWWASSRPDMTYPYTPPAGGPISDTVLLAEFKPPPSV